MACAFGEHAKDCAILHWCPKLGGRAEASGWRAPCPLCGTKRAIEFGVHGSGIRWNSFCGEHSKDTLRPAMRELLGACMPGKSAPAPIDREKLITLMLSSLPPMSMRLAVLEMTGMGTTEALDRLGVRREHRSRVIAGRTGGAPKQVQTRRSLPAPKWVMPAHPNGCNTAGQPMSDSA